MPSAQTKRVAERRDRVKTGIVFGSSVASGVQDLREAGGMPALPDPRSGYWF